MALKCARFDSTIKGISADEFPAFPTIEGVEVALEGETLQSLAKQVAICAAHDESRPIFTGVYIRLTPESITSAAADGFRLGKLHTNGVHVPADRFHAVGAHSGADGLPYLEAIVPASVIVAVARIAAGDSEEPVTLTIGERQVRFSVGPTTIVTNTINGDYPDYNRIIPTKNPITVQMDAAMLTSAVKVAKLFARDSANIIKLGIAPNDEGLCNEVVLSAASAEFGDTVAPVPAHIEGVDGDFQIAFNVLYFADALGAIEAPQIRLQLSAPTSPGILSGAGNDSYVNVIMPMHINGR